MCRFDRTTACLLLLLAGAAEADVDKAKVLYDQGKFEEAAQEFRRSAELGHAESQFNLGALHFNGHGVQRSADLAAAWMFVAADNGYTDAVAEIRRFAADLTPAAESLAQELRARYGKAAIEQRLLPGHATFVPATGTVDDAAAKAFEPNATRRRKPLRTANSGDAPFSASDQTIQMFPGFLAIDMLVAPDGSVRDVLPVLFYPSDVADRDQFRYAFGLKHAAASGAGYASARISRLIITQGTPRTDRFGEDAMRAIAKQSVPCALDGSPRCQFQLVVFPLPQDLQPDTDESFLIRAAQGGHPIAQERLGTMLAIGPERELEKARLWLSHAWENGNGNAAVTLARLEIESVPANWSRAVELLQGTVDKKNERAALALAAVRATCPDERHRSADVENLLKLARGTYGEERIVREIRAARAAALGDFAKAVEEQTKAIDEAHDLSWNVAPLEARLIAYRKNERWFGDLFAF